MIGLDTNVLVRYLTQDDPKQAEIANRFINKSVSLGEALWIGQITLCETVWVLERAYKLTKGEIIDVLHSLLRTKQIRFESKEVVWHALKDYEETKDVGFSDCLIGRQNQFNECAFTYSFDKDAVKNLPSFRILQ